MESFQVRHFDTQSSSASTVDYRSFIEPFHAKIPTATKKLPSKHFSNFNLCDHEAGLAATAFLLNVDYSFSEGGGVPAPPRMESQTYLLGKMVFERRRVETSHSLKSHFDQQLSPIDPIALILVKSGKVQVRDRMFDAGSVIVRDLGQPFQATLHDVELRIVYFSRDYLSTIVPKAMMLNGRAITGQFLSLLCDLIYSLDGAIDSINYDLEAVCAAQLTRDFVTHCLEQEENCSQDTSQLGVIALTHLYVEENLSKETLGPTALCDVLKMSRRRLYRLFEPFGGTANFIRKRRLQRSHALLTDIHERRRIQEIAFEMGFPSAAEFSRAFKRHYGYSPKEARECLPLPALRNWLPSGLADMLQRLSN